jgi:hypothetical protein
VPLRSSARSDEEEAYFALSVSWSKEPCDRKLRDSCFLAVGRDGSGKLELSLEPAAKLIMHLCAIGFSGSLHV